MRFVGAKSSLLLLWASASFAATESGQSQAPITYDMSKFERPGLNLRTNLWVPVVAMTQNPDQRESGFGGNVSADFALDNRWTLGPTFSYLQQKNKSVSTNFLSQSKLYESRDTYMMGAAANYYFEDLNSLKSPFIRAELLMILYRKFNQAENGEFDERSNSTPGWATSIVAGYQWGSKKGFNYSISGGLLVTLVAPGADFPFSTSLNSANWRKVVPWLSADIGWRF
jgi:hypothetical protein